MPTLMSRPTFDLLFEARTQLSTELAEREIGPIMVPWAGEQLVAEGRGVYYVGIATDKEDAPTEQSFEQNLRDTETFVQHPTLGRTPFWRLVDRVSRELLGETYSQTQRLWGWSNLLKIAGTSGPPGAWPQKLIEGQRPACVSAFREEIRRLNNSLILVTSANEYGILHDSVAAGGRWVKRGENGPHVLSDSVSGNTYVQCNHPNYLAQKRTFAVVIDEVILAARETLPTLNRYSARGT
jgi:hypothetical protein